MIGLNLGDKRSINHSMQKLFYLDTQRYTNETDCSVTETVVGLQFVLASNFNNAHNIDEK